MANLSHEQIRNLLADSVRPKKIGSGHQPCGPDEGYIKDVFDDFCIIEKDGRLFKRTFSVSKSGVSLGKPVEVRVSYEPLKPGADVLAAKLNEKKES